MTYQNFSNQNITVSVLACNVCNSTRTYKIPNCIVCLNCGTSELINIRGATLVAVQGSATNTVAAQAAIPPTTTAFPTPTS